jgi:hypothetical protein
MQRGTAPISRRSASSRRNLDAEEYIGLPITFESTALLLAWGRGDEAAFAGRGRSGGGGDSAVTRVG